MILTSVINKALVDNSKTIVAEKATPVYLYYYYYKRCFILFHGKLVFHSNSTLVRSIVANLI